MIRPGSKRKSLGLPTTWATFFLEWRIINKQKKVNGFEPPFPPGTILALGTQTLDR